MPPKSSFPKKQDKPASGEEDSRTRLLEAAIQVFSKHSYEGATTRMIADTAGVNLASIPYYFGGKEGLYLAMVEYVIGGYKSKILPMLEGIQARIQNPDLTKTDYLEVLCEFLRQFMYVMLSADIPMSMMRLMFGEESAPIRVFDVVYENIVVHVHRLVTQLSSQILGIDPESKEAIIRTHAIMGQIIGFHHSREVVFRRLEQSRYSEDDIRLIQDVTLHNIRAILSSRH